MRTLILASASPRRRELLTQMGYSYEVRPARREETCSSTEPDEVVLELSGQKAMEIAEDPLVENAVIVGADTIVVVNDKIMGKPLDSNDAARMLKNLAGQTHFVYTGVTAVLCEGKTRRIHSFFEKTEVSFYPMKQAEISAYIATGEPMDKAGAYGIQGIGAKFIQKINGDYNTVVGLPAARLYQEVLSKWL